MGKIDYVYNFAYFFLKQCENKNVHEKVHFSFKNLPEPILLF